MKKTKAKESKNPTLKEITKVAIVYRSPSDQAVAMAKSVAVWLQARNIQVYTAPGQRLIAKTKFLRGGTKALESLSFVVVLGGDGTYLRAVRIINGAQVPVLGFNMGSLGFLTTSAADSVFETLEKTLAGKMSIQNRMFLQAQVFRRGKPRLKAMALNDFVIERGSFSQLINLSVAKEKHLVCEVKADALIVSSPTGSTAYNLAAGGPLLDPEVKALIITPVAPHALTSRPLIFSAQRKLSFRLEGKLQKAHLIVDGQEATTLTHEDEIVIEKGPTDHLLIEAPHSNFFHLLREKLKFGERA